MALSVEKLLTDAHTLIIHLKEHDTLADSIIATTQTLYNKVEAMKQYQDDITELNEIAKHRPRSTLVLGIAQENRQIRELQQENRELQAALEEHQSALELIMQKYREHTVKLIQSNKVERTLQERESADKDSMCQLMDKIDEMAGVMQKAIEVDETLGCADKERLSRLEVENRALREMLEICTTSKERIISVEEKKEEKKEGGEGEEDNTDTESDSTVLVSPEKKDGEEEKEKEVDDKKKKKTAEAGSRDSTPTPGKDSSPGGGKDSSPGGGKDSSPGGGKDSSPSDGKGSSPSTTTTTKATATSKSAGDVRKGRTPPSGKAEGTSTIKKAISTTGVKKETGPIKKSPSIDAKRDPKGKVTPKTVGKK